MRPGIIANTLPLSPQATTVTYRCRRRIDVSSTNSTRHGRARRRCATRAASARTRLMIRCQPTAWWRATARIDITLASWTRRRANRRDRPAWNWSWSSRWRSPQFPHSNRRRRQTRVVRRPLTPRSRTRFVLWSHTRKQRNPQWRHRDHSRVDATSTSRRSTVSTGTLVTRTPDRCRRTDIRSDIEASPPIQGIFSDRVWGFSMIVNTPSPSSRSWRS